MGMFTEVMVKSGEYYVQIKWGNDWCEKYKIGDNVPFQITEHPGRVNAFDGVYDGIGPGPEYNYHWVVVKDHIIVDVIPNLLDKENETNSYPLNYEQRQFLIKYYNIVGWERSWWSEEAWEEKEKRDKEWKEEFDKKHKAFLNKHGVEESMASVMACHFVTSMYEPSILRKMFTVEKLE